GGKAARPGRAAGGGGEAPPDAAAGLRARGAGCPAPGRAARDRELSPLPRRARRNRETTLLGRRDVLMVCVGARPRSERDFTFQDGLVKREPGNREHERRARASPLGGRREGYVRA